MTHPRGWVLPSVDVALILRRATVHYSKGRIEMGPGKRKLIVHVFTVRRLISLVMIVSPRPFRNLLSLTYHHQHGLASVVSSAALATIALRVIVKKLNIFLMKRSLVRCSLFSESRRKSYREWRYRGIEKK